MEGRGRVLAEGPGPTGGGGSGANDSFSYVSYHFKYCVENAMITWDCGQKV